MTTLKPSTTLFRSLSDIKSFTVVVTEANSAPVLTVPTDRVVAELTTLTVTNTASEADLPGNVLTFSLVSAPGGVDLDSTTGVLTWTPSEVRGASSTQIRAKRTD